MRKWGSWVLLGVLVLLIVTLMILGVCLSEFLTSGIHILGSYAHIKLDKTCYFISSNGNDTQITGESTFTISGLILPQKDDDGLAGMTGHMNVAQYPISLENGYRSNAGYVDREFIHIRNQALSVLNPDYERYYVVWILRSDPNVIVIEIFDADGVITAVCADSKEEALQNYGRYL